MSSSAKLSEEKLQTILTNYPEWRLEGELLIRDLVFDNFIQAMAFINRVAAVAEESHHHPDIVIRYNKVQLALTSHDVGSVTFRDARLAAALQKLL